MAQALFGGRCLGEAELALDVILSRSLGNEPNSIAIESRYWMARILEERGRLDEALLWYAEVTRLDSTHRDALDRARFVKIRAGAK